MTEISNLGDRLVHAVSKRTFHAGKYLHQKLASIGAREPQTVCFIFGCQRSGTTLMTHIFDRDRKARVFGEFSEITQTAWKRPNLRLKPLAQVKAIMAASPARLIVAKPIAETQNATRLLAYFPGSKAVFLYRHYAAVATSNLKLFGVNNGINNLRAVIEGDSANWRAEGVPQDVRALVAARFSEDMDPHDAAALFWYVRNRFYFDLGLDRHAAVKPLKYEDLVREPARTMERLYAFIGSPCPAAVTGMVHSASSGNGKELRLSPDIEALCQDMLQRLDRASLRAWTSA